MQKKTDSTDRIKTAERTSRGVCVYRDIGTKRRVLRAPRHPKTGRAELRDAVDGSVPGENWGLAEISPPESDVYEMPGRCRAAGRDLWAETRKQIRGGAAAPPYQEVQGSKARIFAGKSLPTSWGTGLGWPKHTAVSARNRNGFTLTELLVVISIIAILAAMLAPALALSETESALAKCMSNLRQLTEAWQMYADENRGAFPYNEAGGSPPAWVYGNEDFNGSYDNTNVESYLNPGYAQMGPYIKTVAILKCPSDMSRNFGATGVPRIRSISMNGAIGLGSAGTSAGQGEWLPAPEYECYFKQSDLGRPTPAGLFVFVEEQPDSINDSILAVQMPSSPSATTWIDFPAKYHANSCNFSFADGHVQTRRWQRPQAIPTVTYTGRRDAQVIPSNPDIWWVGSRTSARADGGPNPFPSGD